MCRVRYKRGIWILSFIFKHTIHLYQDNHPVSEVSLRKCLIFIKTTMIKNWKQVTLSLSFISMLFCIFWNFIMASFLMIKQQAWKSIYPLLCKRNIQFCLIDLFSWLQKKRSIELAKINKELMFSSQRKIMQVKKKYRALRSQVNRPDLYIYFLFIFGTAREEKSIFLLQMFVVKSFRFSCALLFYFQHMKKAENHAKW